MALGILTGVVAVGYSRGVWKTQDLFGRLRSPVAQVLLGAILIGALDVLFRAHLWGRGHESLNLGLQELRGLGFEVAMVPLVQVLDV